MIFFLDVDRLRAKAEQPDAPAVLTKALADYDLLVARGEKAVIYLENNDLVVGTVTPAQLQ
jgi:hypothetical protein